MQFAAISIVIVGVLAYIWASRGFFSALLHLACTIVAGAVAFAAWEPLAHLILEKAPAKSNSMWMVDAAWAASLAVPFLVSLALVRTAMDKFVRANAKCSDTVDFVGGLACGLGSGIITAGILVMSLGMLRFKPEMLGYQSLAYTDDAQARGGVERSRPVLRPYADELTAKFYGYLSNAAFRPIGDETLAKWYPHVSDVPSSMRMTFDGKSRNTVRPRDTDFLGGYTVGNRVQGDDVARLIAPQRAIDLSGNPVGKGYLVGLVMNFKSGAKEKTAQVIVGNGQVRLLCDRGDGTTDELHPVAVISQADPSRPELGRWRFDADDTFIASVGGSSEAVMCFEFAVPAGWSPVALYVKNARRLLEGVKLDEFTTLQQRDQAVSRRFGGIAIANSDTGGGGGTPSGNATPDGNTVVFKFPKVPGRQPLPNETTPDAVGIRVANTLGFAIRKGQERGLSVQEGEGSRRGFMITDGEETFSRGEIQSQGGALDAKIRIDRFAVTPDVVMVQLEVSINKPMSLIGPAGLAADKNAPAYITDVSGQKYECIGFIYKDDLYYKVRYTAGQPVGPIAGLPPLSVSKPDATLWLLFRVSYGVETTGFCIGNKVIADWSGVPLKLDRQQR